MNFPESGKWDEKHVSEALKEMADDVGRSRVVAYGEEDEIGFVDGEYLITFRSVLLILASFFFFAQRLRVY